MKFALRFACLLFAVWTGCAQAAVIDFEDVPDDTLLTEAISRGFLISANSSGAVYATDGASCSPPCAANGTRTLLAAGIGNLADTITITRAAGGSFDFSAFDGAETFTPVNGAEEFAARVINVLALLNGNVVANLNFELDQFLDGVGGGEDFQTFSFTGILADTLVFTGSGGTLANGFSLDNLVVTVGGDSTGVPEPGSLALGALGIAAMLAGGRRRQPR